MTRITIPTVDQAPEKSKPKLEAVRAKLGSVPNLFRVLSHSPGALGGYLGLSGALETGKFDLATRERIALAVAEVNGCDYCLSAHTYIGKNLAKLPERALELAREGHAEEGRANAAVELAVALTRGRGKLSEEALSAARHGGLEEGEIVEVVAHVALNVLTNYVNIALETEIDFPRVPSRQAA